jgi:hypothetical protein
MCLQIVRKVGLEKVSGYGWKVFFLRTDTTKTKAKPQLNFLMVGGTIEEGKRMVGKRGEITRSYNRRSYPNGFHVFENYEEAKKYRRIAGTSAVLRKVYYQNVVARGRQYNSRVLVCRFITVLPAGAKILPLLKASA